MYLKCLIIMLLCLPMSLLADDSKGAVVNKILNDLYISNGNHVYLKPSVVITNDDNNAALFLRRSNKIEISERLYNVCKSFEKDSLAALAFVIGHELAHVFQHDYEVGNTSFLAYDRLHEEGHFYEESADVLGIFMAFLAGYDTRSILGELITGIYDEFDLDDELKGYPSLQERQNTITKVHRMSTSLIDIYEGAAFLVSIGEYRLASESYAYVERWFKGKEIYNNLGICKIQEALSLRNSNLFPFVLPFEVEWTTRMSKPLASRGSDGLTPEERLQYDQLLDEAMDYFVLASKMDPTEVGPEINHLCALILKGKPSEALDFGVTANLELRSFLQSSELDYEARLSCARAIAYYILGEEKNAIILWNKIIDNHPDSPGAQQAAYNLSKAEDGNADNPEAITCSYITYDGTSIDGVRLHRPAPQGDWVELDNTGEIALCIDEKEHSTVYTYRTENGYFTMQRILNINYLSISDLDKIQAKLFTNAGFISGCQDQKIALRLNEKGELKEWVRYY